MKKMKGEKKQGNGLLRRALALGLAGTLTAAVLTGCGGSGGGSGDAGDDAGQGGSAKTEVADGRHLNFGCYVYSTSYDPADYQNAAWDGIRHGVTEGLFKFKDDLTVDYNLCDEYEVSDDKKTWTFHIRDGVQFSNGNDCNAQAVADSLNRLYTVCATDKKSSPPIKTGAIPHLI